MVLEGKGGALSLASAPKGASGPPRANTGAEEEARGESVRREESEAGRKPQRGNQKWKSSWTHSSTSFAGRHLDAGWSILRGPRRAKVERTPSPLTPLASPSGGGSLKGEKGFG